MATSPLGKEDTGKAGLRQRAVGQTVAALIPPSSRSSESSRGILSELHFFNLGIHALKH